VSAASRRARPFRPLQRLARNLRRKLLLPDAWWRSRQAARRERACFADLETFCLFVGYPRSGHSVVGSLLDAHPDMVIAHELHVLRYLRYGFGREQIFALLLERSRQQAEAGREFTGYSYAVPGQWQGRFRRLRVIGDKRGGTTIRKLAVRPQLLERLRAVVRLPLRVIHVVRNPFDNVATIQRRSSRSLAKSLDHYLGMVEGVERLHARLPAGEILDVRHEDLLVEPRRELRRMAAFLGVEAPEDWVEACAGIVWKAPSRTRQAIEWPPELRSRLEKRVAEVPFLAGYSWQD
jgi:hypothetical protein